MRSPTGSCSTKGYRSGSNTSKAANASRLIPGADEAVEMSVSITCPTFRSAPERGSKLKRSRSAAPLHRSLFTGPNQPASECRDGDGTPQNCEGGIMKPPPFEYVCPVDLNGVLAALAQNSDETKILAGGQSLVPMMNLRLVAPKRLVDINRIPELSRIAVEGDWLVIGALARHTDVLASPIVRQHAPLVVAAYQHVAHRPIRNRGTMGGNLAHADPASELPAVMLALDAENGAREPQWRTSGARGEIF